DIIPQPVSFADENADAEVNDSEMEDAGYTLEDGEEDDEILGDLDDPDSEDIFSFDLSMDDEEI
ncbi:MAG: hypothetical protein IJX24_01525, partial [Oscillospiraceae bacterium]|nr:hypothetical protein [Oscillospiraceae bacterium]